MATTQSIALKETAVGVVFNEVEFAGIGEWVEGVDRACGLCKMMLGRRMRMAKRKEMMKGWGVGLR